MDFWDLSKLLFRRWYFAVPLLLLSLAATVLIGKSVKPDYISTSYVQLIPPTAAVEEQVPGVTKKDTGPKNPWLELGLTSLSRAGMLTVQDKAMLKQLHAAGLSENVVVTVDDQAPVITIVVVGDTQAQSTQTSNEVFKRLSTSIQTLQADYGAKKESFITIRRLDRGDNIEEANSKVKRALVAVAGVGLLLTIALTIAADALIRRRRNRKAMQGVDAVDAETVATGSADARRYSPPEASGPAPSVNRPKPVQSRRQSASSDDREIPGEKTVVISKTALEDVNATIVLPMRTNGHVKSTGNNQDSQESRSR